MNATAPDPTVRRRNRVVLVTIFALFFGSLLVAGLLRFSGWRPHGLKNHGQLLDPPADLRSLVPHGADGAAYPWNPTARVWRIAVAGPAQCDAACVKLAHDLDTVWQLAGREADRLDVLWLCATPGCAWPEQAPRPSTLHLLQPDPALRAALPRGDAAAAPATTTTTTGTAAGLPAGLPVYVIDPNGFVILRYPPGFDPGGLRADLAKLLKLK